MKKTYDEKSEGKDKDLENYLKSALEHVVAAEHGIQEFSEFALNRLGDKALPHLRSFIKDVQTEVIKVKGVTKSKRKQLFGRHISNEEREQCVREIAYRYAEQRNFANGSPESDWYKAEKDVARQLDKEMGIVQKGYRSLTSGLATELKTVKQDVRKWLRDKHEKAA